MGTRWWGFRHYWDAMRLGEHETNVLNLNCLIALVPDRYFHCLLCKAMFVANWTSFFFCLYTNASTSR